MQLVESALYHLRRAQAELLEAQTSYGKDYEERLAIYEAETESVAEMVSLLLSEARKAA